MLRTLPNHGIRRLPNDNNDALFDEVMYIAVGQHIQQYIIFYLVSAYNDYILACIAVCGNIGVIAVFPHGL